MEFIDSTGHIFSIKSYEQNPIGYEYQINPYIFWLENEYTGRSSVNNYYILPIRILVDKNIQSISISVKDSDFYYLLSSKDIHQLVNELNGLNDYIRINEEMFDTELTEEDLVAVPLENHNLIPFYVIANSPIEGSIISNILIKIVYEDDSAVYTPISVGGVFYDENEILVINSKNMGVHVPKDIIGAIYQCSYYNEVPDETLYANKLKEYLLSYMHIRGQIGNFNSVLDAIKWFGYGDKIEIQKLLQTDNQFQDQFFLDDFTINTDLLHAYKSFRSSTYINLRLWDNAELEEINKQTHNNDNEFWGEGKPKFEDLFSKVIVKHYDEGDIDFYRSYYDYCFDELGLKLAMVDYYFKKYFLPIHLHIHSTSIAHRVWANDIKYLNVPSVHEQEPLVNVGTGLVDFYDLNNYYIYNQEFYTDTNFNNIIKNNKSFYKEVSNNLDDTILYINEPCVRVPINIHGNGYYNCHFILLKDDNKVFESNFQIFQSDDVRYDSLIVLPKYLNKELNNDKEIYWLDSNYTLAICVNDKWYYHKFNIKVPEFQLEVGRLVYKYYISDNVTRYDLSDDNNERYREKWGYEYDHEQYGEDVNDVDIRYKLSNSSSSLHKQVNSISDGEVHFNSFMYVPSLVEVNDINFYDKVSNIIYDITGNKFGYASDIPSDKQVGILTKKDILNKYVSNIKIQDITNNGIEFDSEKLYNVNDTIVPAFYFNDFSRDNNQKIIDNNYQIENLSVKIEIGYVGKNPFVSKTIDLVKDTIYNDEILQHEGLPYGVVKDIKFKLTDWDLRFTDNGTYKTLMQEYDTDDLDEELPFTINRCILQTEVTALTLNITWNLKFVGEDTIYKRSAKDNYLKLSKGNACQHSNCWIIKSGHPEWCSFKQVLADRPQTELDYTKEEHNYYDPLDLDTTQKNLIEVSLNNLISKGVSKINIPNEGDFLNRIHIYDIYYCDDKENSLKDLFINDNFDAPLKYDKEMYGDYQLSIDEWNNNYKTLDENENIIGGYSYNLYNLYRHFFDEEGTQYFNWPGESYFDYDFYLMHDEDRWYIVFISKMPISMANEGDLDPIKELKYTSPEGHKFKFKHYRSGNNFLINRMYFESSNGRNVFPNNSLIVATINNVKYPYILDQGTKWKITPMSLGIDKEKCKSTSKANSCIFSIGENNRKYVRGYYDIDVRYSIDANVQHQQFAKTRICIQ